MLRLSVSRGMGMVLCGIVPHDTMTSGDFALSLVNRYGVIQ